MSDLMQTEKLLEKGLSGKELRRDYRNVPWICYGLDIRRSVQDKVLFIDLTNKMHILAWNEERENSSLRHEF